MDHGSYFQFASNLRLHHWKPGVDNPAHLTAGFIIGVNVAFPKNILMKQKKDNASRFGCAGKRLQSIMQPLDVPLFFLKLPNYYTFNL